MRIRPIVFGLLVVATIALCAFLFWVMLVLKLS